nr:zinc finger, CCHC-type [Tanacetum cinerariifolium]
MARNTVKDMTTNFGKLDKFEGHDFRRWQKKMHFLLTTLKVVYVLTTPMPELLEDATVKAIRIKAKWENDDYICRGHILNGMSDSLFDVYTNVESAKELWDSLESKYMADDSLSKKFLTGHFKRDCRSGNKKNTDAGGSGKGSKDHSQDQGQNLVPIWNRFIKYSILLIFKAFYVHVDAIAWWIDFDATTHDCKDRCLFKTYEPVEDGCVLYMGDDHFALVHGKGSVVLEFSSGKSITLFNVLYVPKLHKNLISGPVLNKCGYKQVYESDKVVVRLSDLKRKTLGEKGIDCIFVGYVEHSKAYRPKDIIPNSDESQKDDHFNDVPGEILEPRKGFRQKEGIDYFDTYAPVARITTIRLLLALAAIHNLVIHQMDVKTAFLNGDLEKKVYMKQPEGLVMSGNKHKVCKLVKSLFGLKQAPQQWHQKFDEVVLSSGFLLNQSHKCVYSKFDSSGKGVINCLYVDDMLIFGTDQNQVDKTKKFLSSRFSINNMGEADIILGIKIKRDKNGL